MPENTTAYLFEARYIYQPGERYSNGRGLSVVTASPDHAAVLFNIYANRDEPYAVTVTSCETGEVVKSHGDMRAATKSMNAAYRLRYPQH